MHTPAPWHYDIGLMVRDASNKLVCNPSARSTPEKTDANGRLIAAAPDLLYACEKVMAVMAGDMPVGLSKVVYDAIAKAKGEA